MAKRKRRSYKYFRPDYVYHPKIKIGKNEKLMIFAAVAALFIIALLLILTKPHEIKYVDIVGNKTVRINVEIADNVAAWQKGLMFRQSMPEYNGMLFIFPDSNFRTFWMKDTLIPLDLIFVSHDMFVVDIKKDFQPCNQTPCEFYTSARPATYLIEINSGFADSHEIVRGNIMTIG
ncbi:MAG: DUF192 domain-containing protein [Candidatus Aenigmarchaeota archaeon]|nr:DUF192 domain-containing protein [Candidatus Aenigmarchaeota archaeon]